MKNQSNFWDKILTGTGNQNLVTAYIWQNCEDEVVKGEELRYMKESYRNSLRWCSYARILEIAGFLLIALISFKSILSGTIGTASFLLLALGGFILVAGIFINFCPKRVRFVNRFEKLGTEFLQHYMGGEHENLKDLNTLVLFSWMKLESRVLELRIPQTLHKHRESDKEWDPLVKMRGITKKEHQVSESIIKMIQVAIELGVFPLQDKPMEYFYLFLATGTRPPFVNDVALA